VLPSPGRIGTVQAMPYVRPERMALAIQAALAVKRLGPCACFSLTVRVPREPAACPVFAAVCYL
jgi:hypothetical protein